MNDYGPAPIATLQGVFIYLEDASKKVQHPEISYRLRATFDIQSLMKAAPADYQA